MAKKNTVEVTYKVKEDGTLGKVGKQADKTAKSTDKLGKSNAKAVKGMKGVGQAGLSASKGFSKMRNSMGDGGGGLVAAYATLAANVFALTAAFAALSGSFQAQTLIASVNFLGNEIGRNLDSTVKKLQDVTDGALSMEAALRGAALGTSAGFSTDQITGLAEVARGASLALGRDMGDAFDRLIRGTAKLEPEILDELGIIVRLDQAYENYATKLGKTATQLTTVEKSQAFTNSALTEGKKKFGDLGLAMKTNPYDKLIASLINLKNQFVGWINETLKFGAAAKFLSENTGALIGLVALFASTIAGKLLPVLFGSAAAMHANAMAAQEMAVAQLSSLSTTNKGAKGWNNYLGGLADGTKTLGDAEEGHKSLNRSIGQHQGQLNRLEKKTGDNTVAINLQKKAIAELNLEKKKLYLAQQLNVQAAAKESASQSIQNFSVFNLKLGYQFLRQSIAEYQLGLVGAGAQTGVFIGILNALKVAAFSTGIGLKALGAMALTAFGWVSAIASVLYTVYALVKDKFFPEDLVKTRTLELLDNIGKLKLVQEQYGGTLKTGVDREMAGIHMVSGAMQQQAQNISDMMSNVKMAEDQKMKAAKASHTASVVAKADALIALDLSKKELVAAQKVRDENLNKTGQFIGDPDEENAILKRVSAAAQAAKEAEVIAEEAVRQVTEKGKGIVALMFEQGDGKNVKAAGLEGINKAIEMMEAGPLSTLFAPAIAQLRELQKEGVSIDDLHNGLAAMANDGEKAEGFIKGIASSVNELEKAQNKFGAKATTPYDEILKTAEGVQNQFNELKKSGEEMTSAVLTNIESLTGKKDQEIFGGAKGIDDFVTNLRKAVKTIREFAGVQKVNKQAQKAIASTQKTSLVSLKAQHQLEQDSIANKEAYYNAAVIATNAAFANKKIDDEGLLAAQAKNKLLKDEFELEKKLYTTGINGVEVKQLENELQKQALEISNKVLDAQVKGLSLRKEMAQVEASINAMAEFRSSKRSAPEESANEIYLRFKAQEVEELRLIEKQRSAALEMAEIDSVMIGLKFELIIEQIKAVRTISEAEEKRLNGYITTLGQALVITKENIELEFDLRKQKIKEEGGQLKNNAIQSIISAAGEGASTTDRLENMHEAMRGTAIPESNTGYGPDTYQPEVKAVNLDSLKASEQVAVLSAMVDPMIEKLKTLGPEGELVASISSGSLSIATAFTTMTEKLDAGADATTEKLKMAGAAISAIAGMVAASSEAKIAGIDREIEAEKRRDGKSAASIAKIAGLEKKKEAVKKKAFEQNKKMQMAMVVINVAASVAANVAAASSAAAAAGLAAPAVFAGVLGTLNAVTIGLGAAQLAVIASTSYQGGGSISGGGSAPSSISMGERENTVDLAKGNNAGGELGYMRGESGTGTGASNFKPTGAFTGARYRGSGGYIVGEQGPELFVPQESGQVISAGNTAGIGGSTNVSFNIQAIDASGVEDVLIGQKGQIIRMIREAANEHGEFFLEGVREEAYQA